MGEFKLIQEIIKLSVADTWEIARSEWELSEIYFSDEPETCLCGHYPIIKLCEIRNKKNQKITIVGNCCVNKFMGLPSEKIFQAVKRIRKDCEKSLNCEAIELAYSKDWINNWEYDFYIDTFRKRLLTKKQALKRKQINEKILLNINKERK